MLILITPKSHIVIVIKQDSTHKRVILHLHHKLEVTVKHFSEKTGQNW